MTILTEPLAIPGCVFLFYWILKLWHEPDLKPAVMVSVWLAFLLFLRPAFVYLIPVLLVALAIALFMKRRQWRLWFSGAAGIVVVTVCFLGYMICFKSHYGIFSCSSVSIINQYFVLRFDGMLKTEEIQDKSLRNYYAQMVRLHGANTQSYKDISKEAYYVESHFSPATASSQIHRSISLHKGTYLKSVVRRSSAMLNDVQLPVPSNLADSTLGIIFFDISPKILFGFLELFLLALLIIIDWRRSRFQWEYFLLLMITVSHMIVSVVGAMNDYPRLLLPNVPFLIIITGIFCERIFQYYRNKKCKSETSGADSTLSV